MNVKGIDELIARTSKGKNFLTKVRNDYKQQQSSKGMFNLRKASNSGTIAYVDSRIGARIDRNVKNDSQLIFSPGVTGSFNNNQGDEN